MKKILSTLAGYMIIVATVSAQGKPPAEVSEAFRVMYPDAKSIRWQKDKGDQYEASFSINRSNHTASYNSKGIWLSASREIEIKELPPAVINAFEQKYPAAKIESVNRLEMPRFNGYKIHYQVGSTKKEVTLNSNGEEV